MTAGMTHKTYRLAETSRELLRTPFHNPNLRRHMNLGRRYEPPSIPRDVEGIVVSAKTDWDGGTGSTVERDGSNLLLQVFVDRHVADAISVPPYGPATGVGQSALTGSIRTHDAHATVIASIHGERNPRSIGRPSRDRCRVAP